MLQDQKISIESITILEGWNTNLVIFDEIEDTSLFSCFI